MQGIELGKALNWDQVAEAYKEHFGGTPRTMPMEQVFDRLSEHDGFNVKKKGTIHKILKKKL